ncbi:hypothetical protein A374_10148 [Fictibacillus macauensis ZFHKF-1]|uniref:HPr domain-containing protein n=1 Tax=Fictibacillus macauensis ZFHKF-1 TaxID=1196324 RepID=I8AJB3_9BACL|nr:HPr family phosphocarrier protein [Fictibacillus macauensis]EIT85589.1 hypothetical protein A374_10148 [Fictibacillus macauensis ZFHKF-1]
MGIPNSVQMMIAFPNRLSREQMLEFVTAAGSFESNVFICDQEVRINGKGLLGMNLFFLSHNSNEAFRTITLKIDGRDAMAASEYLSNLVKSYLN